MAHVVATVFGLGHAPIASGTVASAAAALLWWFAPPPTVPGQWLSGVFFTILGVWSSDMVAKRMKDKDPSVVVIDEVAGMWFALAGTPHTLPVVLVAFGLFRLFDIGKWPPMKQLERLPGGFGIMMDDLAAGLISRVLVGLLLPWLA